jgi:hypothetical protein
MNKFTVSLLTAAILSFSCQAVDLKNDECPNTMSQITSELIEELPSLAQTNTSVAPVVTSKPPVCGE